MKIPAIIDNVLQLLYPGECHICGTLLSPGEEYLCTGCRAMLPRTLYHKSADNPMEQRFAGVIPFERASGHFFYSPGSQLASLIHDFKYRRFAGLARYLGRLIGEELLISGFIGDADIIVPVPMHWIKESRRGYNQSYQLALGMAQATGMKVSEALKAIKGHKTQTSLSHSERLENTKGIFRLTRPDELRGHHIVILDDVCTSGATLTACAEAILSELPDSRISLLSLAVTF